MNLLHLHLRDGTPVTARAMHAGDRDKLAEAYRRLTPESRYNRFWTHTGEVIGNAMLDRILEQDPFRHVSWAVMDPAREFPPIGGASWWRNLNKPEEAEISAIVLDDDHGRGVGTLLLAIMWLTAFRAGVRELVGYALVENRRAADWMRDSGAAGSWDGYKLIFRWDLENLDLLPQTRCAADLASWLAGLSPLFLEDREGS